MNHPGFKYPLRSFGTALRFLTIFPLPGPARDEDAVNFEGALLYFTLTGVLIGMLGALVGTIVYPLVPPLVLGVALTLYLSLVSGFLHLDGLADSADGFLSGRPGPQCLEIMKDSRIGVMGAATICFIIVLKTVSIAAIDPRNLAASLVLVPAAGRTAIILMMAFLPYVRGEKGLGQFFYRGMNRQTALLSALLFIFLCLILLPHKLVLIVVVMGMTIMMFSLLCKKKIHGATGDTLGALCELTEAALLFALSLRL